MTTSQSPHPENTEKGENPDQTGGSHSFRLYRLCQSRERRRTPTPQRAPGRKPGKPPGAAAASLTGHCLRGVPLNWCDGVARLATMPAPDAINNGRWVVLAATSARLLRDHGAALRGAGWDCIALFGLHATAPMTFPPGWGLAWLLSEHGEVLDVAPDAVGLRRHPNGARLALRRVCAAARAGVVPAWALHAGGPAAAQSAPIFNTQTFLLDRVSLLEIL